MDEPEWMAELRIQIEERKDPWVVLEGQDLVESAMVNWWDIVGIVVKKDCEWMPPEWSGLTVDRCDRETHESSVGYSFHRGVLGLARQPEEVTDVHSLMSELSENATIVVCPQMVDPSSVGIVIRNAAALGADAVIFGEESTSPFDLESVRNSGGALFRLPVRIADAGQVLRCLKAGGFTLLGASGAEDAVCLGCGDSISGRVALVLGSDGEGLGSFWNKACDQRLRIPMESEIDTMGVAAASAIFLWELRKLRELGADELEDL